MSSLTVALLFLMQPDNHKLRRITARLMALGRLILVLMLFQILFRRDGVIIWEFWLFRITVEGLSYGLISSLRFFIIIIIAGLLFDIPYYDYLLAFKGWKIPYEISFLVASVIHFIPIFTGQFSRSLEALQLRGIDFRKTSLLLKIRIFTVLVFPVIARAVAEIKWRAVSLELRAFRIYPVRTYLHNRDLTTSDYLVQGSCLVVFLTVLIMF